MKLLKKVREFISLLISWIMVGMVALLAITGLSAPAYLLISGLDTTAEPTPLKIPEFLEPSEVETEESQSVVLKKEWFCPGCGGKITGAHSCISQEIRRYRHAGPVQEGIDIGVEERLKLLKELEEMIQEERDSKP